MIRTMSSTRLYVAGRVAAALTILFIIAAVVIGALAVTRMHPPRAIEHQPGMHSSAQPADRSAASSAATTLASKSVADFASA
jgi:hypothetical protein